MTPAELVDIISSISLERVFNPYAERCVETDLIDAPYRRRMNLLNVLEAGVVQNIDSMWIARDLGYRGGRRTGLPLTDEVHMPQLSAAFGNVRLLRATTGSPVSERTAAIIWRVLSRLTATVFLWNVFPLHPFESDAPMSNRRHTKTESQLCEPLLLSVLDMVRPRRIVAIGRDAETALRRLNVNAHHVRHPSYGGQSAFMAGIASIYGPDMKRQGTDLFPSRWLHKTQEGP